MIKFKPQIIILCFCFLFFSCNKHFSDRVIKKSQSSLDLSYQQTFKTINSGIHETLKTKVGGKIHYKSGGDCIDTSIVETNLYNYIKNSYPTDSQAIFASVYSSLNSSIHLRDTLALIPPSGIDISVCNINNLSPKTSNYIKEIASAIEVSSTRYLDSTDSVHTANPALDSFDASVFITKLTNKFNSIKGEILADGTLTSSDVQILLAAVDCGIFCMPSVGDLASTYYSCFPDGTSNKWTLKAFLHRVVQVVATIVYTMVVGAAVGAALGVAVGIIGGGLAIPGTMAIGAGFGALVGLSEGIGRCQLGHYVIR